MSIYFVDNPKGGVGKSSISALLIRVLMDRGEPMVLEVETRAGSLASLTGGMKIDVWTLPQEAEITRDPAVLEDFYLGIAATVGDAHADGRDVVVDFGSGTSQSFWEKAAIQYLVDKLKDDIVVVVPTTGSADSLNSAVQVLAVTQSIGISRRVLVWNERTTIDRAPASIASLNLDFDEYIIIPCEQTGLLQRAATAGVMIERIISSLSKDEELRDRAVKLFPGDRPLLAQMKALEQFSRLKMWLETALIRMSKITAKASAQVD